MYNKIEKANLVVTTYTCIRQGLESRMLQVFPWLSSATSSKGQVITKIMPRPLASKSHLILRLSVTLQIDSTIFPSDSVNKLI